MVPYQLNNDGTCGTCAVSVVEKHFLECYSCKHKYHADCGGGGGGAASFCTKSFLSTFTGLRNNTNFIFICDHCQTAQENVAASSMKEQLAEVVAAVAQLTNEVKDLKKEKSNAHPPQQDRPAAVPPKPDIPA